MNGEVINKLKEICGTNSVLTEKEDVASFLYDETEINVRPTACEDCVVVRSEEHTSELQSLE